MAANPFHSSRGKRLEKDRFLTEVAGRISNIEEVCNLADILLKGIHHSGGRAWVKAQAAHGGVLNPQKSM